MSSDCEKTQELYIGKAVSLWDRLINGKVARFVKTILEDGNFIIIEVPNLVDDERK